MITYDESSNYGQDVMDLVAMCVELQCESMSSIEVIHQLHRIASFAIDLAHAVAREREDSDYFMVCGGY